MLLTPGERNKTHHEKRFKKEYDKKSMDTNTISYHHHSPEKEPTINGSPFYEAVTSREPSRHSLHNGTIGEVPTTQKRFREGLPQGYHSAAIEPLVKHLGDSKTADHFSILKAMSAVSKDARQASLFALGDHAEHKLSERNKNLARLAANVFEPEFFHMVRGSKYADDFIYWTSAFLEGPSMLSHFVLKSATTMKRAIPLSPVLLGYGIPMVDCIIMGMKKGTFGNINNKPNININNNHNNNSNQEEYDQEWWDIWENEGPRYLDTKTFNRDDLLSVLVEQLTAAIREQKLTSAAEEQRVRNARAAGKYMEVQDYAERDTWEALKRGAERLGSSTIMSRIIDTMHTVCRILEAVKDTRYMMHSRESATVTNALQAYQPQALLMAASEMKRSAFQIPRNEDYVDYVKDMHQNVLKGANKALVSLTHLVKIRQHMPATMPREKHISETKKLNNNHNHNKTNLQKSQNTREQKPWTRYHGIRLDEADRIRHMAQTQRNKPSYKTYGLARYDAHQLRARSLVLEPLKWFVRKALMVFYAGSDFPSSMSFHRMAILIWNFQKQNGQNFKTGQPADVLDPGDFNCSDSQEKRTALLLPPSWTSPVWELKWAESMTRLLLRSRDKKSAPNKENKNESKQKKEAILKTTRYYQDTSLLEDLHRVLRDEGSEAVADVMKLISKEKAELERSANGRSSNSNKMIQSYAILFYAHSLVFAYHVMATLIERVLSSRRPNMMENRVMVHINMENSTPHRKFHKAICNTLDEVRTLWKSAKSRLSLRDLRRLNRYNIVKVNARPLPSS
jgi:hypothetical protein